MSNAPQCRHGHDVGDPCDGCEYERLKDLLTADDVIGSLVAERDALKARAEQAAEEQREACRAEMDALEDRALDAEARIRALEADARRLDWLENQDQLELEHPFRRTTILRLGGRYVHYFSDPTIRGTIDMAILASRTPETPHSE